MPPANLNLPPGQLKPGRGQSPGIGIGGGCKPLFGVLEDIDIAGKTRSFPVQRYAAGYVAVEAASSREQPQGM